MQCLAYSLSNDLFCIHFLIIVVLFIVIRLMLYSMRKSAHGNAVLEDIVVLN